MSDAATVRQFAAGDEDAFRRLNEEWITRYFKLEPKDEIAFDNPRQTILDRGGRIFFAMRAGEPVGVCALLAMRPGEFKRLYLETNQVLLPAIHLYEAVGFTHLPKVRVVASPYARADVFMEMWLG